MAALSLTCTTFYNVTSSDVLWKRLCERELRQKSLNLGNVESYRKLYTNLLHKYKAMLGMYQTQVVHYGGLLEVKYVDGNIVGTAIDGTNDRGEIFQDLKEEVTFTIRGDVEPPEHVCLPGIDGHSCNIEVDPVTGEVHHDCLERGKHINKLKNDSSCSVNHLDFETVRSKLQHIIKRFSKSNVPLISKPLKIPSPDDIPTALRLTNGKVPSQIITPGLFKGDYSSHGVEVILFKYASDNELHGIKVTGDPNIPAGKISIKCYLDFPLQPTLKEQGFLKSLASVEKKKREVSLDELPKQTFMLPADLYIDDLSSAVHAPETCMARYHGACHLAHTNFINAAFAPAHVIVFNNDLIGLIVMKLRHLFLLTRINRTFVLPYNQDVKSVF